MDKSRGFTACFGKCIRGEEPNKLSLLKAQSQQDLFLRELNELASIANANPDSLEAQNKFQDKHNILLLLKSSEINNF